MVWTILHYLLFSLHWSCIQFAHAGISGHVMTGHNNMKVERVKSWPHRAILAKNLDNFFIAFLFWFVLCNSVTSLLFICCSSGPSDKLGWFPIPRVKFLFLSVWKLETVFRQKPIILGDPFCFVFLPFFILLTLCGCFEVSYHVMTN